jgi:DHA1 family tetracycline resistance protein-like MFS transporter
VTSTSTRNPIIFVFITRVIDAIGFGIVMPVLPQLLLHMGAPDVAAATRIGGFLLVTYAVLQFFCGPIMGNLSDRFGRRVVILTSLFAYGVDYMLMGFAPTIGWLFVGRAVAGIAGAVFVPANAYVADITKPEDRAHAYGLMGSAFGLGFIIGPAVGGFLGEIGPRAPFFAASALAACNFVFGLLVMPESLPPERRRAFDWRRANPLGAFRMFKKYPGVLAYALALLAYLLGNNVYPSTWAYYMTAKFNSSSGMIGLTLVATGAAMAIVQAFFTGRIAKRIGESSAAMLGLAFAATVNVVYALLTVQWFIFVFAFLGALQAIAFPSLNALMTKHVPPDAQGELQGGVASISSIANVVGPFVMTQTFALFTASNAPVYFPGAAFFLASTLSLFGITVLMWRRGLQPATISPH